MRGIILDKEKRRKDSIYRNFQDTALVKAQQIYLESAVGVVFNSKNELLIGLAIADDERDGRWCFPGGGIDGNDESCLEAAIREVYEETGIVAEPISTSVTIHPIKPKVGFCLLRAKSEKFTPNQEFSALEWVSLQELPSELLDINREVLQILNTKR